MLLPSFKNGGENVSQITYQTIEVYNQYCGCNVAIHLRATVDELPEGLTAIKIKKKDDSQIVWSTIHTHPVTSIEDLTVSFEDQNVIAGKHYTYAAIPVISGREGIGVTARIVADFQGWMIADSTAEYVVGLNVVFNKQKKTSLAYIQTLGSKYPYAVSNGNLNYYVGSFSGLFLPRGDNGEFTKDNAYAFKTQVMEFLANGKTKILKSGEGEAMKIRVDDTIDLEQNEFKDAANIKFNFTEIGDFPSTGLKATTIPDVPDIPDIPDVPGGGGDDEDEDVVMILDEGTLDNAVLA